MSILSIETTVLENRDTDDRNLYPGDTFCFSK